MAWVLFRRLAGFQEDLESTLQRGSTRWGFVKRRPLSHWDIVAMFKYLYSLLCCSSHVCTIKTAPISTRTLSIIQHTRRLSRMYDSQVLRREIRDLDGLYSATLEGDIASLVFMNGCVVFVASILIVIAFAVRNEVLQDFATFLTLASVFGAILAMFHLWRKVVILVKLMFTLTNKVRNANTDERFNIRKIRQVAFAQTMLTLTLLLSSSSQQSLSLGPLPTKSSLNQSLVTTKYHFSWLLVLFVQLYLLQSCSLLLSLLCDTSYLQRSASLSVKPFAARLKKCMVSCRFDQTMLTRSKCRNVKLGSMWRGSFSIGTVLMQSSAADRFGSILQYIQGGMDRRQ